MISSPGWAGRQWRTIARLLGGAEKVLVDPERRQVGAAPRRLLLVAHADPDVGVDRVGAGGGRARVVGQLHPVPLLELVAGRRRDDDLDAAELAGDRQRAGDVVAVADVGEPEAGQVAEPLAQGQQVGERLAGMVERGQRVDDRDLGLARRARRRSRASRSGSRSRRRSARGPGRCPRSTPRGRAAAHRRAGRSGSRRARRRRPRRRSWSGSRAVRRPARCCGRRARSRRRRRGARLSAPRPGRAASPSSKAPNSSPVRKSRFKALILSRCSSPQSPGTSSTGAISRPTRGSAPGARGCCGSRSATRPTSRSTATSMAEFAAMLASCRVGRRAAAGVPAALRRSPRPRRRRRGPAGADLAQLAGAAAPRSPPRSTPT